MNLFFPLFSRPDFNPFLIKTRSSSGIKTIATASDTMREMESVQGKKVTKSNICPVIVKSNGKKITQIHSVANKIELK